VCYRAEIQWENYTHLHGQVTKQGMGKCAQCLSQKKIFPSVMFYTMKSAVQVRKKPRWKTIYENIILLSLLLKKKRRNAANLWVYETHFMLDTDKNVSYPTNALCSCFFVCLFVCLFCCCWFLFVLFLFYYYLVNNFTNEILKA